jgi:hypothetical protein
VLEGNQLWFSNPLLMNDLQEVRWGVLEGTRLALTDEGIAAACNSQEMLKLLQEFIERYLSEFEGDHALDTYIFCFCRHEPNDFDGLLSMWRGYGNQAGGVAVVLDTEKLAGEGDSTLALARVWYGSDEERIAWLTASFQRFAALLRETNPPDELLYIAAWALFERIKLFAIFSKHNGFSEEQEWRAAYLPWRDTEQVYQAHFGYQVTPSGVHPKLKLPIDLIPLEDGTECTLEKIVDRIILGPTVSSPLAAASLKRMLDLRHRPDLKQFVHASGIPFRRV